MSECFCNSCKVWSPIRNNVRKKLSGKLLKQFDALMNHISHIEDDANYNASMLDGSWPGWEWLPKEIKRRNKLTENLRNKTPLNPKINY